MIDHGEKILAPFSKTDWANRILVRVKKIIKLDIIYICVYNVYIYTLYVCSPRNK